jgi:hypothetical protein
VSGEIEFFGQPRLHPPAEACRSFADAFGITEDEARAHLERGTAAGLIETRGPYVCNTCGGSKPYPSAYCRCGDLTAGYRDRPMPGGPMLDGAEGLAQIRRRYVVPL